MANTVDTHVSGFRELAKKLAKLGPEIRTKHMSYAVMKGATAVRDEARLLAPQPGKSRSGRSLGSLLNAIILKFIKDQSTTTRVSYFVLARRGSKFKGKTTRLKLKKNEAGPTQQVNLDAFYWRFVEFGTANQRAQPFLRPAFEAKKNEAVGIIKKYLKEGLDQSVRAGMK